MQNKNTKENQENIQQSHKMVSVKERLALMTNKLNDIYQVNSPLKAAREERANELNELIRMRNQRFVVDTKAVPAKDPSSENHNHILLQGAVSNNENNLEQNENSNKGSVSNHEHSNKGSVSNHENLNKGSVSSRNLYQAPISQTNNCIVPDSQQPSFNEGNPSFFPLQPDTAHSVDSRDDGSNLSLVNPPSFNSDSHIITSSQNQSSCQDDDSENSKCLALADSSIKSSFRKRYKNRDSDEQVETVDETPKNESIQLPSEKPWALPEPAGISKKDRPVYPSLGYPANQNLAPQHNSTFVSKDRPEDFFRKLISTDNLGSPIYRLDQQQQQANLSSFSVHPEGGLESERVAADQHHTYIIDSNHAQATDQERHDECSDDYESGEKTITDDSFDKNMSQIIESRLNASSVNLNESKLNIDSLVNEIDILNLSTAIEKSKEFDNLMNSSREARLLDGPKPNDPTAQEDIFLEKLEQGEKLRKLSKTLSQTRQPAAHYSNTTNDEGERGANLNRDHSFHNRKFYKHPDIPFPLNNRVVPNNNFENVDKQSDQFFEDHDTTLTEPAPTSQSETDQNEQLIALHTPDQDACFNNVNAVLRKFSNFDSRMLDAAKHSSLNEENMPNYINENHFESTRHSVKDQNQPNQLDYKNLPTAFFLNDSSHLLNKTASHKSVHSSKSRRTRSPSQKSSEVWNIFGTLRGTKRHLASLFKNKLADLDALQQRTTRSCSAESRKFKDLFRREENLDQSLHYKNEHSEFCCIHHKKARLATIQNCYQLAAAQKTIGYQTSKALDFVYKVSSTDHACLPSTLEAERLLLLTSYRYNFFKQKAMRLERLLMAEDTCTCIGLSRKSSLSPAAVARKKSANSGSIRKPQTNCGGKEGDDYSLQTRISQVVDKTNVGLATCTIKVMEIKVKVSDLYTQCLTMLDSANSYKFYFMAVLSLANFDDKILSTRVVSIFDVKNGGVLDLNASFTLYNVDCTENLIVDLYARKVYSKPKDSNLRHKATSKLKKYSTMIFKPKKSETSTNASDRLRSPLFKLVGSCIIPISSMARTKFDLTDFDKNFPILPCIQAKFDCIPNFGGDAKGYLTISRNIAGYPAWYRYYCVLQDRHLKMWDTEANYTNHQEAVMAIELDWDIKSNITCLPMHVCARLYTFELKLLMDKDASNFMENNQLADNVEVTPLANKYQIISVWLSCDDKEWRKYWMQAFTIHMEKYKSWLSIFTQSSQDVQKRYIHQV